MKIGIFRFDFPISKVLKKKHRNKVHKHGILQHVRNSEFGFHFLFEGTWIESKTPYQIKTLLYRIDTYTYWGTSRKANSTQSIYRYQKHSNLGRKIKLWFQSQLKLNTRK